MPAQSEICPVCRKQRDSARTVLRSVAAAVGGGAIAATLAACYGPPCASEACDGRYSPYCDDEASDLDRRPLLRYVRLRRDAGDHGRRRHGRRRTRSELRWRGRDSLGRRGSNPHHDALRAASPNDPEERSHPAFAVWELTLRCDQACKHCGSDAGEHGSEAQRERGARRRS